MQRVILIIMLVTVTSIVSYSWSSKTPQTPTSSLELEEGSQPIDDRSLADNHATETKQNTSHPSVKPETINRQKYAEQLVSLEGKSLFNELDQFWAQCEQASNCTAQLSQLKSQLPRKWFELLSHYPTLYSEWQTMESTIPLESIDSLEARVELFKQSAQEVWGELAHQLFADQFARLDFTLSTNTLEEIEPTEFIAHYQDLLAEWANRSGTLNAETSAQQYELAVSLLPNSYSSAEFESIKALLQETYLDESQVINITAREQQIAQQQQIVMSYQAQLDQLKATLDSQRTSSYATWTQQDWDSYYQQQVTDFREQFFSK